MNKIYYVHTDKAGKNTKFNTFGDAMEKKFAVGGIVTERYEKIPEPVACFYVGCKALPRREYEKRAVGA